MTKCLVHHCGSADGGGQQLAAGGRHLGAAHADTIYAVTALLQCPYQSRTVGVGTGLGGTYENTIRFIRSKHSLLLSPFIAPVLAKHPTDIIQERADLTRACQPRPHLILRKIFAANAQAAAQNVSKTGTNARVLSKD
jgi:hypothetical protein